MQPAATHSIKAHQECGACGMGEGDEGQLASPSRGTVLQLDYIVSGLQQTVEQATIGDRLRANTMMHIVMTRCVQTLFLALASTPRSVLIMFVLPNDAAFVF